MSFRPEHVAPPEIFYNDLEARKYALNSRMMAIQSSMTERAMDLLHLSDTNTPLHILDIGCGSGLSGEAITDAGHVWTGVDISTSMLGVAVARSVEGSLLCVDIGTGLPFRAGSFDAAISISVIQWLCNADQSNHSPSKRLHKFFSSLHLCLSNSARAVFQFYPENAQQVTMITEAALRSGFSGGVVIDYPNSTKAKKYFLCLNVSSTSRSLPKGLDEEHTNSSAVDQQPQRRTAQFSRAVNSRSSKGKSNAHRAPVKSHAWIAEKKERRKRKGLAVPESKYSGRQRRPKF